MTQYPRSTYQGTRLFEESLQLVQVLAHQVQNWSQVHDAHAVDHLHHGMFQGVSAVLCVHLEMLLHLYKPIAQRVE